MLVVVRELQGGSFHLINREGKLLSASDSLTTHLRKGNVDFASMPYTGESDIQRTLEIEHFNETDYL